MATEAQRALEVGPVERKSGPRVEEQEEPKRGQEDEEQGVKVVEARSQRQSDHRRGPCVPPDDVGERR